MGGYTYGDVDGTLYGFGQSWNFQYYLDGNADVTMQIYQPGAYSTLFSVDALGRATPTGSASLVQTVVGNTPRYLEGNASPFSQNTEIWDEGTSSGTKVPAGIYWVYFRVDDPTLSVPFAYGAATTIAVVPIRFTAFNTTAITASNAVADINYTVTANCNFRAVIAQPGRQFTIDSNGLVQALNAAGTAIDTSTNSVVQVITGQRNFNNPSTSFNTETWNGTNLLGVAVSTGVYALGISATDSYGNQALNLAGNNGPLEGTIAVDRVPAQTAPTGTAPQVSSITVNGTVLNLSSNNTQVSGFSSINITLSAAAGAATTVTLTGPNGAITNGVTTENGVTVTLSTSVVQSSTGTYTLVVTPYDTTGAYPGTQVTASFVVVTTPGPTVASVSVGGTSVVLAGGTTVSPFQTISVTLSAVAGSSTTLVLSGPDGVVPGGNVTYSGTSVLYSTAVAVSTAGAYNLTINPFDTTNTYPGTSTIVPFVVSATGVSGSSSGTPQSPQQLSYSIVPYPNPAKNCARISFQTEVNPSDATIDIYTLTGARVLHQIVSCPSVSMTPTCSGASSPALGTTAASNNCVFAWPLNNDQGGAVSSGVYNLHITINNTEGEVDAWKKIMVIK